MTATKPMTSLRRRPMPGMPGPAPEAETHAPSPEVEQLEPGEPPAVPVAPKPRRRSTAATPSGSASIRRHQVDYSTVHLANFRLPVDLHARYGKLIADAQECHSQLRKVSMTEVVIALLAEGPQTADEVAELIRRKRADEHGGGESR